MNSIANPIGRIRKTHALIASARRNHVVDGNTLVGIVNQRHREVSIRSVANSAVIAPRQCDLTPPRYSAAECSEAARDYPSTPSPSSNQRQNQAKLHRLQKRNSQSKFSALRQLLRATSVLHIRSNTHLLAKCYPCPFVSSVGNIFSPTDFHRFARICFLGSRQCVRDWSGILLERSGKRYSGKPDCDSRNALLFKV